MRIGVDATCWASPRGYGRFTRELLRAMVPLAPDDTFVCFVDQGIGTAFDLAAPNVVPRVVTLGHAPATAAATSGNRTLTDMLRLTRAVWRERLDVFFSPTVYTYFPLPAGLPAVVTVHDAIADRFPELTLPGARDRVFWRLKVWLALHQARLILTVSDFAARDIARVLRVPPGRLRVALEAPAHAYTAPPPPANLASVGESLGLPPDATWFVYVGGFNPHKNVDLLVRAHAALAREAGARAPYLLLVGPVETDVFHNDQARIRGVIDAEGTSGLVRWLGYLPDDRLRLLHARALALALPSTCEGFGLPAVEAAACGAPVVATTESPLPQLLEGGGLFVAPGDLPGLTTALGRMMADAPMRARMGQRARQKAGELSWPRGAGAALAALRDVV